MGKGLDPLGDDELREAFDLVREDALVGPHA
jgi:Cu2+-containing amine oxidase